MAIGYSSQKVKVHVQDGAEFLIHHKSSFDVIITDSSDPIGEHLSGLHLYGHFACCCWSRSRKVLI